MDFNKRALTIYKRPLVTFWQGCTFNHLLCPSRSVVFMRPAVLRRDYWGIDLWLDDLAAFAWWRHQMETFSSSLTLCAGNSPVTGEFPTQRPVKRNFDAFFGLCLNKRLSEQSRHRSFETSSRSLWRHCNVCIGLTQDSDSGLRTQDSGRIYSTWIYTVLLFIRYTQVCQYRINTILPDTKLICMLGDFYKGHSWPLA